MNIAKSGLGHRGDIDGLRAIAITSVVAYHCGLPGVGGGYAGVDIFFVISGYLIGSLVYRDIRENSFSITRFYSRRAKRILPALFGVLIISYIAAVLFLSPVETRRFSETALAAVTSSSNIFFWRTSGYFAPHSDQNPLLMTWSLGVEEQFYLLFPALMLLLRKVSRRSLLSALAGAGVLSLTVSIAATMFRPEAAFFLLPSRAWELGAGVLLAVWEAGEYRKLPALPAHALSVAGLASMLAAVALFNASTPFPGYAALLPVAGATMVIAARDGIVNRLFSWRPIAFVGLVSYSWYLWHWPLLSFARVCAVTEPSVYARIGLALAAFVLSVISWRFIEQPFRRSSSTGSRLLTRYAMSSAVIALAAVLLVVVPAHGASGDNLRALDKVGDSLHADECVASYGASAADFSPRCAPDGSAPAVALIGDSHAGALASGVRQLAAQHGYRMLELTKSSCPALDGVTRNAVGHPLHEKQCSEFNRDVLSYITRNPAIRIVIMTAYWSAPFKTEAIGGRYLLDGEDDGAVSVSQSRALLETGLAAEIRAFESAGKEVYLVQDSPSFDFDPRAELRAELIAPRRVVANLLSRPVDQSGVAAPEAGRAITDAALIVETVARENAHAHLVNLWAPLCSASGCRFAIGARSLYVDDQHLSPLGAQIALSGLKLPPAPPEPDDGQRASISDKSSDRHRLP